ncbi:MAG: ATP-binding cassette domain-containing protein [Planctomycetota bacterium]
MSHDGASTESALDIDGLRFRYERRGHWVVDVAGLRLGAGEQALVTGPSGCGKSTLLHLIAGLIEPEHGGVRVAGDSVFGVRGSARDELRGRTIGMIFQTHQLLSGFTAAENVMAGLLFGDVDRSEHRGRADELLGRLGVDAVDRPVERLSVGQQQRVAVARAVAGSPALVLADEPTASLDPDAGRGVIELIQEVCREHSAALLCVSHDPSIVDRFERRHAFASLGAKPPGSAG